MTHRLSPEFFLPDQPIYPAQGIFTLISQAWNLCRLHLKESLRFLMVPTLIQIVFIILLTLLSGKTFLTAVTLQALAFKLVVIILLLLLGFPLFFYWVFCCCTLIRFYYLGLTSPEAPTLGECWRYALKAWPSIVGLTIFSGFLLVVLLVLDGLILFFGLLISGAVLGALGGTLSPGSHRSVVTIGMMLSFMLVLGFLVLTLIVSLIVFQSFLFTFPLISLSTESQPRSHQPRRTGFSHFTGVLKLLLTNLPRVIGFSLALFGFTWLMVIVMMSPAWVWSALELNRLGINQQHVIPEYVQAVLNLWNTVVNLIVLPFHLSALTLFWYDCQVRREGMDLQLWLQRLMGRQNKKLEDSLNSGLS